MRQKIDYGIDLGTTNSAIARMESGEAVIIKSDDSQMDTTPSCVSFNKKKTVFAGLSAKNQGEREAASAFRSRRHAQSNSFLEFKRTMGTDHRYESSAMQRSFLSEELSAEVLKKLRSYVRDEEVRSIVITVPAMFKQNQVDATQRAAEIAGFKYCELLQEPIAASIAYGIKANSATGHWLVFDFGGGTFDAALMHVEEGIMKVVDTAGNNHLGGKNIDTAIVDELFIPEIRKQCEIDALLDDPASKSTLQDALKGYAEQAKIALSSKQEYKYFLDDFGEDASGEEMQLELKITLSQFESVCGPIFQKAIDICMDLLARNSLRGSDLASVILVGGPTFSQTLRGMLKEQITTRIDTNVDPMTAVAKGAALFASTKSVPSDLQKRDTSKAQLTLKYPETTVEAHENLGIRVDRKKSSGTLPSTLAIEVIRADRGWSSGRIEMNGDSEIVEIHLNEGKPNQFDIKLFGADGSIVPCEPGSITIIHGLKIANPTLPYSIGLEVYDTTDGKQGVYPLNKEGLGKNQSLPAKGKGNYRTAKDIRPGMKSDMFEVRLYEFDYGTEGSRAIFNNPFGSCTVNGEQLPALLPAQSDVELTLSIDASRRASLSIFIPRLDETIEVKFESSTQIAEEVAVLQDDVEQAREIIDKIGASENPADTSVHEADLDEIEQLLSDRGNDYDTKILARDKLKKISIALDKLEALNQWPEIESKLDGAIERLLVNDQRYGDEKSQKLVAEYQERVCEAKCGKDVKVAKQLIDELSAFSWALIQHDIGLWMSWIKEYDQEFETIVWTDKREARRVLNEAKSAIATKPSKNKVEEAVRALWALMPKEKSEAARKASDELLIR
jgi:molecular chaperone DnaK